MIYYQNVMEYREELFSLSGEQTGYFEALAQKYKKPVKMLRIACETGRLELELARNGNDIIGVESSLKLIEAANRRKKQHMHNLRFFYMEPKEIILHLPEYFFDIIYCLNDKLIFMNTPQALEQFFSDCHALLVPGGKLILQLNNYSAMSQPVHNLPDEHAPRCIIKSKIVSAQNNTLFTQKVETGTGKSIPIIEDEPVFPVTPDEIADLAEETGFSGCVLYEDYTKKAFAENSKTVLCEISR